MDTRTSAPNRQVSCRTRLSRDHIEEMMGADCCIHEKGMAHQAEGAEEVIIEAHEVHLPNGSQGLLLRQLTGPRAKA